MELTQDESPEAVTHHESQERNNNPIRTIIVLGKKGITERDNRSDPPFDGRVRAIAAHQLARLEYLSSNNAEGKSWPKVVFVGGRTMGDAKPAEATSMGNFTQSKYTKSDPEAYFGNIPPENITTVDESKDTVHNLIAVAQLITDTPGQTVIVTSDVHVARVEQTLKTLTVDDVGSEKILGAIQAIRVLSAEAILSTISKASGSNPFEHLVQHYLKSPRNRTNKVVEAFLRSWLTAHPNSFIKASDKASDALRK